MQTVSNTPPLAASSVCGLSEGKSKITFSVLIGQDKGCRCGCAYLFKNLNNHLNISLTLAPGKHTNLQGHSNTAQPMATCMPISD